MTFRVRHEWPTTSRRVLAAELVSCPHCHTLRVTEEGKPTRYLRRVAAEHERDRTEEPPCIEPPPSPKRASAHAAATRARALASAISRDPRETFGESSPEE